METPTVRRREDVIRVRPVFAFPGLFSQNFFLDTPDFTAKMNTPTLQELNVGVFFSQGTQPALHLLHSDGNADRASREGARFAGTHHCSSRPPVLTPVLTPALTPVFIARPSPPVYFKGR
jgi:hypothetical protein